MYMRSDTTNTIPNELQDSTTPTSWDPSTISNLIFGVIMVFVGLVAIWQGRHGRVVALEGALAIMSPSHRSRSSLQLAHIEFDGAIPMPAYYVLPETSNALPFMEQLAAVNGECNSNGIPLGGDYASTIALSTRASTLSSTGYVDKPVQHTQALMAELDITDVEGCEHAENVAGHETIKSDGVP